MSKKETDKKKKLAIAVVTTVFAAVVLGIIIGVVVKIQVNDVMTILPRFNGQVSAFTGDNLNISDLAQIDSAEKSYIDSHIKWYGTADSDTTNAKVSEDGQFLFVGDFEGELEVMVHAVSASGTEKSAKATIMISAKE